jgi:hypothetical protein
MAVTFTKPSELDAATTVTGTAAIIVDNGTTVEKATPKQVVDAGRPVSSEAQAVAGTDNETTMTPLTVRQALDADTSGAVAKAQAWAESDTAPGDPGTKSAKTWAGESGGYATAAAASADKAELFDGPKFNTIALMALYDAEDGDVATVLSAFNGGVEHFDWIEGGSLTADEALVVDGVGGQWVSKRTVYADWGEFDADPRDMTGLTVLIQNVGSYDIVASGGNLPGPNGSKRYARPLPWGGYSIKQFGAVGDGATIDTAAIQAAYDATDAGECRSVFWPTGVYKCDDEITVGPKASTDAGGSDTTILLKAHSGDGFVQSNSVSFTNNKVFCRNLTVKADTGFVNTGWGFRFIKCVDMDIDNLTSQDNLEGFEFDTTLLCNVGSIYVTSNTYANTTRAALSLNKNCNGNKFGIVRIVQSGGIGVKMNVVAPGGLYALSFDTLDIEYCNTPVDTTGVISGVIITNYYAEFNTGGIKLRTGASNWTFNSGFISGTAADPIPMFDKDSYGGRNITVRGIADLYPCGFGGVPIKGDFGNTPIAPALSTPSITRDISVDNGSIAKSGVSILSGGSPFSWATEKNNQRINAMVMNQSGQWSDGIASVTTEVGAGIGGTNAYNIPSGVNIFTSFWCDAAMGGRTFTTQVLVKGQAGGRVRLRQGDNVTGQRDQKYDLTDDKWHLLFITVTWGAGSTGSNGLFAIANEGTTDFIACIPNAWDGFVPLTPALRSSAQDGYSDYPYVIFDNLGKTVTVHGTAAPVSGTWAQGDTVKNTAPTAGGVDSWRCVASGAPGTWKALTLDA